MPRTRKAVVYLDTIAEDIAAELYNLGISKRLLPSSLVRLILDKEYESISKYLLSGNIVDTPIGRLELKERKVNQQLTGESITVKVQHSISEKLKSQYFSQGDAEE